MALQALLRPVRRFCSVSPAFNAKLSEPIPCPEPVATHKQFVPKAVVNFSDQLNEVARELQVNLRTILPKHTSNHMFDFVNVVVHGERFPLCFLARTTCLSPCEAEITPSNPSHLPQLEQSLQKCSASLSLSRTATSLTVKVLHYDSSSALAKVAEFECIAKYKIRAIIARQHDHAQTVGFPNCCQSEKLHLYLLEQAIAEKTRQIA